LVHWYKDKTRLILSLAELTLVKMILTIPVMIMIILRQTRMRATIKF